MKRILLFIVFVLSICASQAQDVIVFKSGEIKEGKVLEILSDVVKYKRKDNPEGPTYSVNKDLILNILYENGTTEQMSNLERNKSLDNSKTKNIVNTKEIDNARLVQSDRKKNVSWAFDLGLGCQLLFPTNVSAYDVNTGLEIDFHAKIVFGNKIAFSFGENYAKHSMFLYNIHESTFIKNWDERPTVMLEDGWRQNISFNSHQLDLQFMYNPFANITGNKVFKGFLYFGDVLCINYHKDFGDNVFTNFLKIGIRPTVYFNKHWGIFEDTSYMFAPDAYMGYSEQNHIQGITSTVGVSFRF